MSDLAAKRVDLLLQQLEQLPTLPAVAVKVLEATGDDDSSAKQVTEIIENDPALSARILQLVHRSDVGVRGEVSSVERAIVLLGYQAVRSAVLAVSVFETFGPAAATPAPGAASHFSRDEFWKHCLGVACCAELLAEELRRAKQPSVDPSEAFIGGLLHDLGKVALDAALPKSFSRVVEAADLLRGNMADVERSVIGIDHMVVGKRLAERWGLPANLRDCIWLHGQLPEALPATVRNPLLVNLVTLADHLVREQHLGYSGNYTFLIARPVLLAATGLGNSQVERALQKLAEQIEPRARSLGLGQSTSSELYRAAITQANRELGRVTDQLAARNRRLAIRARFFEALSQFHGELRPDAPPNTVLQAIGQTASAVLEAAPVAAFSIPPGREYAECVIVGKAGDVLQSGLADFTSGQQLDETLAVGGSAPASPFASLRSTPGEGPVRLVGQELEWLVASLSPRLGSERRWWIALEADGEIIGGVVWGGASSEGQRLSTQLDELAALANGWSLALRTCQIREEARALSEQLAEANRQLQNAQTEILRSRTMVTIGEVAAGAAHEMNNPLAVISGRSQLLASELSDPRQKGAAALVAEQAQRLSDIITELMAFAKPTAPKAVACEVVTLIDAALRQAKQQHELADRTVEILPGDVPAVKVDPQQLASALAETLANAWQATDARSGHVEIGAAYDAFSRRVVLTVTDNGHGMDENTLRHAFDPFFSAKPAGRRRGMGLAKALRWTEHSGGQLRLESRPNAGTRAVFLLPADGSARSSEPAVQQKKQA
jgi:putative nucleotidyltransferase with HDIG domain